jgi:hypothetical protein
VCHAGLTTCRTSRELAIASRSGTHCVMGKCAKAADVWHLGQYFRHRSCGCRYRWLQDLSSLTCALLASRELKMSRSSLNWTSWASTCFNPTQGNILHSSSISPSDDTRCCASVCCNRLVLCVSCHSMEMTGCCWVTSLHQSTTSPPTGLPALVTHAMRLTQRLSHSHSHTLTHHQATHSFESHSVMDLIQAPDAGQHLRRSAMQPWQVGAGCVLQD